MIACPCCDSETSESQPTRCAVCGAEFEWEAELVGEDWKPRFSIAKEGTMPPPCRECWCEVYTLAEVERGVCEDCAAAAVEAAKSLALEMHPSAAEVESTRAADREHDKLLDNAETPEPEPEEEDQA